MGSCQCGKRKDYEPHIDPVDWYTSGKPENKKILLIGAANSGKTSLLKQLRYLHGSGVQKDDHTNKHYVDDIRQRCIKNMTMLLEIVNDEQNIQLLKSLSMNNASDLAKISKLIANLWWKDEIKIVYKYRFNYGQDGFLFDDNMELFLDDIDQIMLDHYRPSKEQIISYRKEHSHSTPMQLKFEVTENVNVDIFDIPDYDRKTWIKYFEHVTCLIFIASLTDYCIIDKDTGNNLMMNSLDLFGEIVNLRWFIHTSIILFLNKHDLFYNNCLQNVSLRQCFDDLPSEFPEYQNPKICIVVPWMQRQNFKDKNKEFPNDVIELIQKYLKHLKDDELDTYYDRAIEFIKQKFHSKNKNPQEKQIYTHLTCTIDRSNTEKVFNDVQHIIINTSLARGS